MYGLSSAATSQNGVSHRGDTKVIASLAAAVLLAAFAVIEVRSTHALLPIRVLRGRDRTGSYLISLCVGAALFGMFFFPTIFVQNVWGYSPLKTGLAFLQVTAMIILASGIASQAVPGGSIGLALLATVAWSAVANSLRSQTAAAAGHPLTAATQTQIQHHALATGFSHGFLVCAAIGLLALIIALAAIRVTRQDLSGVDPLAAPAD